MVFIGFLALAVLGILSRLPQLSYNQYPFVQCDENIYFLESQRLILDNSVVFNEFRGGGFNFLPTTLSVVFGFHLDPLTLQLFGRFLLAVFIGGIAPALAFLLANRLTKKFLIALVVGLSTLFSPLLIINSVYWYPDSYIVSFALLAVLLSPMSSEGGVTSRWKLILLGIVCGLGLSVKVTFAVVILFVMNLVWINDRQNFLKPVARSSFTTVFVPAFLTWLSLNWPALVTPLDFIRNNGGNLVVYQGDTRSIEGLLFYAIAAGPMALGAIQSVGILVGSAFAFKLRDQFGRAAVVALTIGIVVFGLQAQWLHRNMTTFFVFSLILFALGMNYTWEKLRASDKHCGAGFALVTIALVAVTSLGFVQSTFERSRIGASGPSIHQQATDFILIENPRSLFPVPIKTDCQLSVYDQVSKMGWTANQGKGVLEVVYVNATRRTFIADPIISQLPDQWLSNLTGDLYRPSKDSTWFSSLFNEQSEAATPRAKFNDGFFEYRIYEIKP